MEFQIEGSFVRVGFKFRIINNPESGFSRWSLTLSEAEACKTCSSTSILLRKDKKQRQQSKQENNIKRRAEVPAKRPKKQLTEQ